MYGDIVNKLGDSASIHEGRRLRSGFPSVDTLSPMLLEIRKVLFPYHFGSAGLLNPNIHFHISESISLIATILRSQAYDAYYSNVEINRETAVGLADAAVVVLVEGLPEIREHVITDVDAAFDGDPALINIDEAILCYPGIFAITCQRIANLLHAAGVPYLPRIITEYAHSKTGIDIHPGAKIGKRFFIDHGTGVVIGETCIIGNNVKIYQGVTLGAKSFPLDQNGNPIKGIDRHPIIGDDVIIYANATVLGRIRIGNGNVIPSSAIITSDMPDIEK